MLPSQPTMRLRLPDSGSVLGALVGSLGDPATPSSGNWTTESVTAEQLDEALTALCRGDLEFLILEAGEDFLQVAGEGDGPYQIEVSEHGEMRALAAGALLAAMREIVHAYRRGDTGWRDAAWTPLT